jgi:hypothetical protein
MEKIKSFIKKHLPFIVFIVTMLLDTTNGFLESVFPNNVWATVLLRAIGGGLLAYYYNPNQKINPKNK